MTAYEWAMAIATGVIAVAAIGALLQIIIVRRARWQSLWEFLSRQGTALAGQLGRVETRIDDIPSRRMRTELRRKWHYHLDAREELLRIQPYGRWWPPWNLFEPEIRKNYKRLLSWYWKGLKLYSSRYGNTFEEIKIYHDPDKGDPDPHETGYRILDRLNDLITWHRKNPELPDCASIEELMIAHNIRTIPGNRDLRKEAIENRLEELRRIHLVEVDKCEAKWKLSEMARDIVGT